MRLFTGSIWYLYIGTWMKMGNRGKESGKRENECNGVISSNTLSFTLSFALF